MSKSPKSTKSAQDDEAVRTHYRNIGISPETIELAIVARRHRPTPNRPTPMSSKTKKRKPTNPTR
jgi:hypothetical protein